MASLFLTAILALSAALCTAQDSIQYQLVIRNAAGQLITNKLVNMKFSLISGGQSFYEETQKTTTDKYGNISVFVGTGTAVKGAMKDVPWSTMDISMKVEADTDGGNSFKELGTVPMAAAPYAMYAAMVGGNGSSGSSKDDEALFEVCDRDGQPVFAVYDNGIVVYVDETAKAPRSGFKVTGRNTKDGESADYFSVDAEGTHVYIDDNADNTKNPRSSLKVTGRNTKGASGSYAAERTADKSSGADIFAVESGITHVYINEDESKNPRSGLIITGRNTKDGNIVDINTARTNLMTNELNIAGKADENVEPQPGEEPTQPQSLFTISSGQIGVNTGITMLGDVEKKVGAEITDEYDIIVDDEQLYTEVSCGTYLPNVSRYALMAIYSEDSYVAVTPTNGQYIILFDEFGNITKQHDKAALLTVLLRNKIQIRALKPMQQSIEFGLMDASIAATGEPYQFVKLKAEINAEQGHPFVVQTNGGVIRTLGEFSFGQIVTFMAVPDENFSLVCWNDNNSRESQRSEYVGIDFETLSARFIQTVYYVNQNGNDKNSGLLEKRPLKTIAKAVEAINNKSNSENDLGNMAWTIKIVSALEEPQTIEGGINAESITIAGKNSACTLNGASSGPALTINTTTPIIIKNLIITGGSTSDAGGGIYNDGGSITLQTGATITGNYAKFRGGGIFNNNGTIIMESGSSVSNNRVDDNYENKAYRGGGGILSCGGVVEINSGATISDNTAGCRGGGIMFHDKAQVTLNGGTISGNTAGYYGGGVMFGNASDESSIELRSTFTMNSGNIENNTTNSNASWNGYGGGVYIVWGEFVMEGGSIKNNQAANSAGGVYIAAHHDKDIAIFTMEGGDITGNQVKNTSTTIGGCGVYSYGLFNMSGGTISGNKYKDNDTGEVDTRRGKGAVIRKDMFTISGTAKFTADNDVMLIVETEDQQTVFNKITIGELAEGNDIVATITAGRYENGVHVLTEENSENGYLQQFRTRFAVNPDKVDGYDVTWLIDETGCLKRSITVKAYTTKDNSQTFNLIGSQTTINSVEYEGSSEYFDYNFDHWAVITKEKRIEPITTFTHDTTIYAIWNATATISDNLEQVLADVDDSKCNYTINVNGQQTGQFVIPATVEAMSLTLNGANTSTGLNGNNEGTVLTVYSPAPVIIKNLTISGGNSTGNGGGIYCAVGSNVTLDVGAIVGDNNQNDAATATSYGNKAVNGGGVYVDGGILTLKDGSVIGYNYVSNHGGGVYVVAGGKLIIETGSKIVYNYGLDEAGGVWIEENAVAEMTGGKINNNKAKTFAGGIEIMGTFTMSGGTISYNEVTDYIDGEGYAGGGVFIGAKGVFNMSDSASIIGNKTRGCQGGAVKVAHKTGTFRMTGGIIQGNTATECPNGGGVRVESSNFFIGGSAYIASDNVVQLTEIDENNPGNLYKVNISSWLTNPKVATILLPSSSYEEGVQVLEGDDDYVSWLYLRFTLGNNETPLLIISDEGKLQYPIGSKARPDAIGDIVFNDGSATAYAEDLVLTDDQKDAAVSVIFYKGTDCSDDDSERILGVGVHNSYEEGEEEGRYEWAADAYDALVYRFVATFCHPAGYDSNITEYDAGEIDFEGYSYNNNYYFVKNGSDNRTRMEDQALWNFSYHAEESYPACHWAYSYGNRNGYKGAWYNDWYMPSLAEMCYIYRNLATVNNAIDLLGKTQLKAEGDASYWQSSENASDKKTWSVNLASGIITSSAKNSGKFVCVIREF